MPRTRRQRQIIDDHEEEDGVYHRADIEDTMIMFEEGEAVQEEERRTGQVNEDEANFERTLQNLRKACVSEKSQNNYMCSMTNMINWFAVHGPEEVRGVRVLDRNWRDELRLMDNDRERKVWIRSKLDLANVEDAPINFDTFKAGK